MASFRFKQQQKNVEAMPSLSRNFFRACVGWKGPRAHEIVSNSGHRELESDILPFLDRLP